MTKVVIVSTSAATCKGHPTGLWLEELAVPYYQFKSLGYEIILASPTGGPIPIDASSLRGDYFNDDCKKFMVRETPIFCDIHWSFSTLCTFRPALLHTPDFCFTLA